MSRTLRAAVFMRAALWLASQWVVLCVRKWTSLFWALRAVHLRNGYMLRKITFSTLFQDKRRQRLLASLIRINRHKAFYSTKTILSIDNTDWRTKVGGTSVMWKKKHFSYTKLSRKPLFLLTLDHYSNSYFFIAQSLMIALSIFFPRWAET